jgi:hypothetical protein
MCCLLVSFRVSDKRLAAMLLELDSGLVMKGIGPSMSSEFEIKVFVIA